MLAIHTGGAGSSGSAVVRESVVRGHTVQGPVRGPGEAEQLVSIGGYPLNGSLEQADDRETPRIFAETPAVGRETIAMSQEGR